MADDSDTPRFTRRRLATNTERDLASLRAKRERDKNSAEIVSGMVSDPFEGVDTGVTQQILENAELKRLFVRSEHNRALIIAAREEAANRDLEIAGEKPPPIRFDRVEKGIRRIHWIVTVIAIPAISSTILMGKYLYARGVDDALAKMQRDRDHETIEMLEKRLTELQRRLEERPK